MHGLWCRHQPPRDVLARARIKREREKAALRFAKDRDLGKLEATMARLDAEAEAEVARPSRIPTAAEARAYLESLPDLWERTSDAGRHAIAEAVFERIDVLGATDFTFTLTAHARARGWDAAFGAGVVRVKEGRSGRGERIRADGSHAPDRATRSHREGPAWCRMTSHWETIASPSASPSRLRRSHPEFGGLMPRAVVSLAALAVLLLASGSAAPAAFAECFPIPDADTRVERPIVFTATVGGVTTEPDLASADAGEGPGVLWQAPMDVRTVYGGDVPPSLALHGSTSNVGVGGGCSWFLGDRVETGDVVFVAVDEIIPFATNTGLFGHLLLWRRVGDEWRFYERALQDGADPGAYPAGAREADTTQEILAVVARLGTPDTATIEPAAPSIAVEPLLLLAAGIGAAAWSIKVRRRRE